MVKTCIQFGQLVNINLNISPRMWKGVWVWSFPPWTEENRLCAIMESSLYTAQRLMVALGSWLNAKRCRKCSYLSTWQFISKRCLIWHLTVQWGLYILFVETFNRRYDIIKNCVSGSQPSCIYCWGANDRQVGPNQENRECSREFS